MKAMKLTSKYQTASISKYVRPTWLATRLVIRKGYSMYEQSHVLASRQQIGHGITLWQIFRTSLTLTETTSPLHTADPYSFKRRRLLRLILFYFLDFLIVICYQ